MPIIINTRYIAASTVTIVAPTGVPPRIDMNIPVKAATIDIITEQIVTDLKLPNTHIADRAGKMISADISSEPTRFMPKTMITAMIMAIIRL